MNTKLYYDSPYIKKWDTTVKKTISKDNEYYIVLEETAFYPHGGGQPSDSGSISDIPVLDVFIEGTEIFHKIEYIPNTLNGHSTVTCKLDWSRRFDHMQQHSGQHLLSAIFRENLQANTISFHLGKEDVTIDLDKTDFTDEQLAAVEREVNEQIYQNRQIHTYFITNEQLKTIPVVKEPTVKDNIRIVEIEGIEYNACGGTHVSRTGEIGMIKLFKAERLKEFTRIHFKSGYRALDDFRKTIQITDMLAKKFNTGRNDILDRFEKWENEQKQLKEELIALKEQNDDYLIKQLLTNKKGNVLSHIFPDKSIKDLQKLAVKITKAQQLIVLFITTQENKVLLYHDGTRQLSSGEFYKKHLHSFNGKGGGNAKSAQAGFPSSAEALRFYYFANEEIGQ